MVNYNYLVLFSTLCCPLDTGFRLWETAVGELELLSGKKFPNRKWRKPCISTFKRTQQNISQRWSHVRLYGPLHVHHLPDRNNRLLPVRPGYMTDRSNSLCIQCSWPLINREGTTIVCTKKGLYCRSGRLTILTNVHNCTRLSISFMLSITQKLQTI